MNVIRSGIAKDDGIDLCRDLFIQRHAWDGCYVLDFRPMGTLIIPDRSLRFKQPGTAWNTDGLERGAYSQADCLIRPTVISDQEIGRERVKPSGHAFTAGIETTSCR